jgi:outer membrane protein assembly factor BamE (lipoprotein component of BamABCDE complex)
LGLVASSTKLVYRFRAAGQAGRNMRELLLQSRIFKTSAARLAVATLCIASLAGCNAAQTLTPRETLNQGYVVDQASLEMVPVGSSREQVLLALGTPSTTATFDDEIFYYISQTKVRGAAFMNAKVVDRRVLAVYFGEDSRVINIASYGMQDGKVFDFISRTTPTAGKDQNFIGQLLTGVGGMVGGLNPLGRN